MTPKAAWEHMVKGVPLKARVPLNQAHLPEATRCTGERGAVLKGPRLGPKEGSEGLVFNDD